MTLDAQTLASHRGVLVDGAIGGEESTGNDDEAITVDERVEGTAENWGQMVVDDGDDGEESQ
jgi:hypothetical protein